MNAEILCVGTEILLGDIVNTNAADIARELASLGINVYHHEVVGDNAKRLAQSLDIAFAHHDLVVMTGGLGPTYDDLTKETVAAYFGKKLVLNEEYLGELMKFFNKLDRPMTENNKKQAMMPQNAHILPNPNGTAPGYVIEGKGKIAIMMPGPPREMRPMLQGPVREYLLKSSDSMLVSKVINFFGIGESQLEDRLKDMMIGLINPTVAPYAKTGEVQLRVTARGKSKAECIGIINPVVAEIKEKFAEGEIYGENFLGLNEAVVKVLIENKHTLATAESCTGGLVSNRIVEIKGSSDMFVGGVVSYSNEMKMNTLNVSRETLEQEGAVSEQCAIEMAKGIRALTGADIAVATTGIAGPDGATDGKPVGLVYVAVTSEKETLVRKLNLARGRADDRESIRNSSTCHAYHMAILASRALIK